MICDQCETVAHCLKNGCVPKTTTKDEALKLALEALNSFPAKHLTPFISSAITAIREALASEASEESSGVAQPAQQGYWEEQPDGSMIPVDPSEMQPAQPQQEPFCYHDGRNIVGKEFAHHSDVFPLYTSPPASNQCKFPLCQNEDYQQALAEQIKQELYTGEPAQRKPLTPEWYAQWIRNNYQDYWNIATLCDEMTKAAHGIEG